MAAPILFHIGYHKTATTWLQRTLFTPAHGYRPLLSHEQVFETIVRPHGLTFDPAPARGLLNDAMGNRIDGVPVVSSEIMSGNPFYGGRESDAVARRIATIAPDARILITLREQKSAARSMYMQYISRGGCMTPRQFFAETPEVGYYAFDSGQLEYDRLTGLYRDLFGGANVLIVTQEHIAADLGGATAKIARFAEAGPAAVVSASASEGVSLPEFALPLARRVNHFRSGPAKPDPVIDLGVVSAILYRGTSWVARQEAVRKRLGHYRPVTDEVTRRFTGRYAESNRRLLDMVGHQEGFERYDGMTSRLADALSHRTAAAAE